MDTLMLGIVYMMLLVSIAKLTSKFLRYAVRKQYGDRNG